MAAAPPPCGTPAAWVGLGPALPPQPPPVRRRHAQELRAPRGHGGGPPAGSGGVAAGGRVRVPLPPQALEDVDPAGQARRRAAPRRDRGGRDPQRVPVGGLDQCLPVGHDREELPGTGERAQAAGQQQRVSGEGEAVRRGQEAGPEVAGVPGVPGCRSRPRRQGRNTRPQSPTGQWWSSPRPRHPWRLHPSRQADQGQAPSAAPEAPAGPSRPQQRRGVGPPREDAGRPGQLQQQRRSRPKGRGARL